MKIVALILTSHNVGDAVCASVAATVRVWALRFGLRVSLPQGAAAAAAAVAAAVAAAAPSHTEAFTQGSFSDRRWYTHRSFYTQMPLETQKLSHIDASTHSRHGSFKTEALMQGSLYKQKLLREVGFIQNIFLTPRNIYTQKLLDTDTCTLRNFYTEKLHTQKFFPTGAFSHRSFCAQTPLHKEALTDTSLKRRSFYTEQLLHKEVFSQRFLDTEELLHRDDALTHKPFLRRSFYTEEPFHRAAFTRFKAAFRRHGMGWHAAKPRTPAPNFRHSWYASCRSSICLIS